MKDLTKATVAATLRRKGLNPVARSILEIRQASSKTSTAKFNSLKSATNSDGRFRGGLQYDGASRTGRWSGRTVQPQNFPRPTVKDTDTAVQTILNGTTSFLYDNPMEVASSCIRSMIAAPDGYKLAVSDLAGIEARMLPYLCNDDETLEIIRKNLDLYVKAAAGIYGVEYDDVTPEQRQIGKVAVLALGYQGAVNAFQSMAKNYGVNIDETTAAEIVKNWRANNPKIVKFWYGIQDAAIKAIQNPGKVYSVGKIRVATQDQWLLLRLPSGRFIPYFQPMLEEDPKFKRLKITHMGQNQYTRKWERLSTYGGSMAENCSQGASRDVLAANLPLIAAAGFEIVTTVHDEVVTVIPDHSDFTIEKLNTLLATVPSWAEGLPLKAEGYISHRYRK